MDCESDTPNISPAALESAITDKTKAVMPVHYGGHACDMPRIVEIARRHRLSIIEDAAHSFPAKIGNQWIGAIGDATCFSFYATKTITTGEGGMLTTNDDRIADRVRVMSLHGISKDAWKRYTAEGSWFYEVISPGFKYNMTDIAAALGLAQLAKHHAFYEARLRIAQRYQEAFSAFRDVLILPETRPNVQHAWHLYPIRLKARNDFIKELRGRNIGVSVHFIPLHLHPYYRETFGYQPEQFPNATAAFEGLVSLPIYPKMNDGDIEDVIESTCDLLSKHRL